MTCSGRSSRSRPSPSSTLPCAGEVTEVNSALGQKPEAVNTNPHESWMIALKVTDGEADLLDATQYTELVK